MLAKNSSETALAIGIRVMDGRIERIPGDVGNPATFPFPVLCRAVAGATLQRLIVERDPIPRCKAFVNAHMQSAGSWKLEAWLTVAGFFKLRASSLLPQAYICLG